MQAATELSYSACQFVVVGFRNILPGQCSFLGIFNLGMPVVHRSCISLLIHTLRRVYHTHTHMHAHTHTHRHVHIHMLAWTEPWIHHPETIEREGGQLLPKSRLKLSAFHPQINPLTTQSDISMVSNFELWQFFRVSSDNLTTFICLLVSGSSAVIKVNWAFARVFSVSSAVYERCLGILS